MIYVCNLREMPSHVQVVRPRRLVSLVAPDEQPPTPAEVSPERHLRIAIHDVVEPMPDCVLPDSHHISALVEFLHAWVDDGPLLVHCVAGISRSMAAALIALSLNSGGYELQAAQRLRHAAPHANPNRRMIALADNLLGRAGRLLAAREAMGPAQPLDSGPLVRLPLLNGTELAEK